MLELLSKQETSIFTKQCNEMFYCQTKLIYHTPNKDLKRSTSILLQNHLQLVGTFFSSD